MWANKPEHNIRMCYGTPTFIESSYSIAWHIHHKGLFKDSWLSMSVTKGRLNTILIYICSVSEDESQDEKFGVFLFYVFSIYHPCDYINKKVHLIWSVIKLIRFNQVTSGWSLTENQADWPPKLFTLSKSTTVCKLTFFLLPYRKKKSYICSVHNHVCDIMSFWDRLGGYKQEITLDFKMQEVHVDQWEDIG